MERNELRRHLESKFKDGYRTSYDRENEVLRIERATDRFGVNIRLAPLVAKTKVRGKSQSKRSSTISKWHSQPMIPSR